MGRLLESFLAFAKGERAGGLWNLLAPLGGVASPPPPFSPNGRCLSR